MNILYIVSEFEPVQNAVAIRTKAHVDALLKAKQSVHIITGPMSKNNSEYDISTTVISPPSNKSYFILRLVKEIIFGLEIGFRVLFGAKYTHAVITSPPFIMTLIVSFFMTLKKIPYSVDVRDRYPEVMFSLDLIKKKSLLGRWLLSLEKNLYKRAINIITVTQSLVNSIQDELNIELVHLVRNGFSKAIFNNNNNNDAGLSKEDVPMIIMHGTFGKFFDVNIFMKIIQELDKHELSYQVVIIGEGTKLENIKSKKFKNVKILGHMKQIKLIGWLQSAHIGLSIHTDNSSMRGAFPVKVFEYIGCCVPSVVIPMNEAGKQVQEENLGYAYPSGEWKSAVNMIIKLLKDVEHHDKMVKRISQKRDFFSREHQSKVFVDILT